MRECEGEDGEKGFYLGGRRGSAVLFMGSPLDTVRDQEIEYIPLN